MITALLLMVLVLALFAAFSVARNTATDIDPERIQRKIESIDSLLPQTQCGKCGYAGCRPYAEAIAHSDAMIDLCPPGGESTLRALARLLNREPGSALDNMQDENRNFVARIDEDLCIGCVKCINACPVDAIIGAPKAMHTVIKQYCTGCELCIDPCPVDCISMVPVWTRTREWVWPKPGSKSGAPA